MEESALIQNHQTMEKCRNQKRFTRVSPPAPPDPARCWLLDMTSSCSTPIIRPASTAPQTNVSRLSVRFMKRVIDHFENSSWGYLTLYLLNYTSIHFMSSHERRLVKEIRCQSTPPTRVFEMVYSQKPGRIRSNRWETPSEHGVKWGTEGDIG